jgi:hypothetical protein
MIQPIGTLRIGNDPFYAVTHHTRSTDSYSVTIHGIPKIGLKDYFIEESPQFAMLSQANDWQEAALKRHRARYEGRVAHRLSAA